MAPAASLPKKIPFSDIPSHLQQQILRKMDAKCFIPMRSTCSSMVPMVEECLKNLKYENMTIASLKSISLWPEEVTICRQEGRERKNAHQSFEGRATLPATVLDSFVWKFVDFPDLFIYDEETGRKFLEILRQRESTPDLCVNVLQCPVSIAVEALKILKPTTFYALRCKGDVREILSQLPSCALNRNCSVTAKIWTVFEDPDEYLAKEGFEIVENLLNERNVRLLLVKSPSGHFFSLELSLGMVVCTQKNMNS